ncbi:hypothetical protein VPH35_078519 [Triticum aestivum]
MSETRCRWRSRDSISISVWNSCSPCCVRRLPRFTATTVSSRIVPLYTFPNPPSPMTIPSSNPPVASWSAANGILYPAPAPFCPSRTVFPLLLEKLREREREPSALAENGDQASAGFFFSGSLPRSILKAMNPSTITSVAPQTAEPAMIPILTFELRGDVAAAPAPALPTILMISRPLRKPSGNALSSVDDPMLTVMAPLASLAPRRKSLYTGMDSRLNVSREIS